MLLLLPPSETKSPGGDGALTLASLGFPALASGRCAALRALRDLVQAGQDASTPAKRRAAEANAAVESSGVMPAIERYSGVLYDALDAASLDATARAWVSEHVAIGSALFGLVRADDEIPDYKLPHSTRVPGTTLRRVWAEVGELMQGGLVVDMRSKAYSALLPVAGAIAFDVVDEHGVALSHWNKHAKGDFVRRLAQSGAQASTVDELVGASSAAGMDLRPEPAGLVLVTTRPATNAGRSAPEPR